MIEPAEAIATKIAKDIAMMASEWSLEALAAKPRMLEMTERIEEMRTKQAQTSQTIRTHLSFLVTPISKMMPPIVVKAPFPAP